MTARFHVVLAVLLACAPLPARVTRIVVEKHESPAFNGRGFGAAGQYEILRGRFYGELDPKDAHNRIVNDIQFAPRNARGMVEYSGTFALSKPVDMTRSNGVLYYSVVNRGNGDVAGFDDGRVNLVSGWQGDLPPNEKLETIAVPVAKRPDGSPLTGMALARWINIPPHTSTVTLAAAGLTYQRPLTLDTARATLTRRASAGAGARPVAAGDWAFADCSATPFPGTPDPERICLRGGFDPASEYVLAFTAKDPLVLGIGYAATRDLNAFLRRAAKDESGTANPVAGRIRWAITRGNSQSGNFIRSFIHLGFNQDEAGEIVWDGANPHIAVRQLAMNYRFAVAGGTAREFEPGSDGVVWWWDYEDKTRRHPSAGLIDRCRATGTCPKIIETFGAVEFWFLRASPDLVGTDAKHDIPLPPFVRRYYFPGTSHGGGRGGFRAAAANTPAGCVVAANPNPEAEQMRAVDAALFDWVMKGAEPPPSRYPSLADGNLVPPLKSATGFPAIPGAPDPDGLLNPVYDFDFGRDFAYNDESGVITHEPPAIRQVIPMLVPKVNADGNETAGVPSVLLQAPLGTYVGWNVKADGFEKGRICELSGGYFPFAATKAERQAKGDARLSLEERYGSHQGYVDAVKKAADKAVAERMLLRADADRLIAEAAASSVLKRN